MNHFCSLRCLPLERRLLSLLGLVREAGAALVAAAFQNQAACTIFHTCREAVLVGAVALFGLIRSFWHM